MRLKFIPQPPPLPLQGRGDPDAATDNCLSLLEKVAFASGVRDKFTIEPFANQLQRLSATL